MGADFTSFSGAKEALISAEKGMVTGWLRISLTASF
jgi:hypothetical protein